MTPESILMSVIPMIGGIGVWLVRQEGRINTHDKLIDAQVKINDKVDQKLDQIINHVMDLKAGTAARHTT